MNIGMMVNNLATSGGYQKLVIRLTQELQRRGHLVTIYTPLFDPVACFPEMIGDCTVVTMSVESTQLNNHLGLLARISRMLAEPLSEARRYSQLAKLVSPETDHLIIHDDYSLYALPWVPQLRHQGKVLWMLNNQLPDEYQSLSHYLRARFAGTGFHLLPMMFKLLQLPNFIRAYRLIMKGVARVSVFATYDNFNKGLVRTILHRDATNVSAGADTIEFERLYTSRHAPRADAFRLLSVGVIFPHRRYEDILRATALLNDSGFSIQTTIVGSAKHAPEHVRHLKLLTQELGIEQRVRFLQYIPTNELHELYRQADAFVFVNDGFTWGISVFEAIAAGVPVIITNNIGAADLVQNRKHGWVVRPRSPVEIAEAIRDIHSGQHLSAIIEAGRREILSSVSWSAYTDRLLVCLNPA
ncbi:MAG: glycosyltransferase family 4 protein [Patescibacteria group bacterium]